MTRKQLSILLIDDDEVDRLTVKRALKKSNVPALFAEAQNGNEAIAILQKTKNQLVGCSRNNLFSQNIKNQINSFDLILLDYRLPDLDGLQLISEIKALNLQLPIIVLTGQGDEEIAVEIMKAGALDYLSKSKLESHNLVKAIKNAIRVHRAEQAVAIANQRLRASNDLLVLKNKELEKQQDRIRLQNIQLQEAYNLKSEFLATMSHELRTPMNAIMGFSQLLLRQYPDPLSEQQQNLVQRIFHNSNNLLIMINEMLDFSKIEAGKLEPSPEKLDLAFLIKLTVEELRSLALQKQLDLATDIQLQDNYLIQDEKFIKRIIVNLLSNGIKFTDAGNVTIKAWEIDESRIAISVTDTGIGIAPKDRDKIFQAFRQADQTFTRQHSGTGLGLAITRSLVTMIGGKISVESESGQGSTFTVEIPRKYDG